MEMITGGSTPAAHCVSKSIRVLSTQGRASFVLILRFHTPHFLRLSYESGPGYSVGGEKPGGKGLNTLIEASRDPGMKGAILRDVRETVWRHGWDIYNYFALVTQVSRYGCWGATEDWKDRIPGPPKLQAICKDIDTPFTPNPPLAHSLAHAQALFSFFLFFASLILKRAPPTVTAAGPLRAPPTVTAAGPLDSLARSCFPAVVFVPSQTNSPAPRQPTSTPGPSLPTASGRWITGPADRGAAGQPGAGGIAVCRRCPGPRARRAVYTDINIILVVFGSGR